MRLEPNIDVRELGCEVDGESLCTRAIQEAIDRCASQGGGTVRFTPGKYLSGTLFLKSNVQLLLEPGSVLLGSPDLEHYPVTPSVLESRTNQYNVRSLIIAEDLDKISISGSGTIDGNGSHFRNKSHDGNRPLILRVISCRDVSVSGITMQNSGFWNQHYLACDRVKIHGIRVWNHATYNADGLDIDGCRDVIVSGCIIDSDDDALCLKSTMDRACENIIISDCILSSHCNALKMGTDSTGGFIGVTITNCSIISPRFSDVLYGLQRGISGISLELVDGGLMERIVISNVTIDGVEVPLFIRLGDRGTGLNLPGVDEPKRSVGRIDGVSLSNIVITRGGKTGSSIVGIPGHPIENVSLSHVSIGVEGGGVYDESPGGVPERVDGYPEATMFGRLPAYGLYCRHANNLRLVGLNLACRDADERFGLVLDDVTQSVVDGLSGSFDGGAPIKITGCQDIFMRGCQARTSGSPVIVVGGLSNERIGVVGNDFSGIETPISYVEHAVPICVRLAGNID